MVDRREVVARLIMRLVSSMASLYGLIMQIRSWNIMTYFTTLSNIFVMIVLSIFAYYDILMLKKDKSKKLKEYSIPKILYKIKFMATISISLTFFVFMFLLAPNISGGIIKAYIGKDCSSFALHFLGPILAIIDFIMHDYRFESKKIDAIYVTIPPIIYVIFVYILSFFGYRWGTMCAPYNFLNYGAPTGWFGFDLSIMGWESLGIGVFYMIVVLLLIFIGFGLLLLSISKKVKNKKIKE